MLLKSDIEASSPKVPTTAWLLRYVAAYYVGEHYVTPVSVVGYALGPELMDGDEVAGLA